MVYLHWQDSTEVMSISECNESKVQKVQSSFKKEKVLYVGKTAFDFVISHLNFVIFLYLCGYYGCSHRRIIR